MDKADIQARGQFLKHLRDALNHLYDPDRLRRNPLGKVFGVADRFNTPSSLQRILTGAIESLKPEVDEPLQSPARRIHELLFYRYVQQFSQQEVADQLGISTRHLRREQSAALEALACHLWEQFHPEEKLREGADVEGNDQNDEASPTVSEELAWLENAPPEEKSTTLEQTLPEVLRLVQPLAVQRGVDLEVIPADTLPTLAVNPVALRQILLNLLGAAIHRASGGRVCISAKPLSWEVEIEVECTGGPPSHQRPPGDEKTNLDMVHRLTKLCEGRLTLPADEEGFGATLVLPALEQLPVLVIDDNVDTLQLLQRYASGTRYRLIGTQDPEQALSLAKTHSPEIVLLDVMMPHIDGWEILGRLRQHPLTSHIPIIVCTILPQEDLALSLGARSFLHKPVKRQEFLDALDQQVMGSEPRG